MKTIIRAIILVAAVILTAAPVYAQKIKQTQAFKSGETLECNFYFNWKFIWVKAGGASLVIRDTVFNGQKAQYMSLLSSTNSTADAFFRMRDTLTTIFTPDLRPLYYRKASAEGKRYYLNQVWYSYEDDGRIKVTQYYRRDNEKPVYKEEYVNQPVYDMMSLLAYARTLDFSSLKKGQRLTFPVATGKRITQQHLIYRGKKRTKSDDGNDSYDCLLISLVEERDGKEREIINFHVTNDENHLPILLDLALNFGSAKARLSYSSGLLYPLKALK
ncbi:MAG: DUF3108 domain-containing protein [Bacteroidaceae bacterium]|nr:DUF3108 domain-containing protein [Bacteroidaceae bacterium]